MILTRRQVFLDLALLLAATAGLSGTLLGWADAPVRVIGGLALSMFAPGYALLRALYPRALSSAERYALSVPVSFVLAILIGATVDLTPAHLSGNLIVVVLWLSTVTLLALAYVQSYRARGTHLAPIRQLRTPIGAAALVLSILLVEVALVWAGFSVFQAGRTTPKPFTALSVDGASGIQQSGVPLSVTLDNEEGQSMQYDLQVTVGGSEISRVDGVQLDSGKSFSLQLPVLADDDTAGADVIAYRSGESTPYRTVHVGPPPQT
jgi:uncharacterized membrane protein